MNGSLHDLYPPLVLEHARHPRNRRAPLRHDHRACGDNPLCGDHLEVFLCVAAERIGDIAFDGDACAIATASASLMTECLLGQGLADARRLHAAFLRLVGGAGDGSALGPLQVFGTMAAARSREPCITLAWQALDAALTLAAHGGAAMASPAPPRTDPREDPWMP